MINGHLINHHYIIELYNDLIGKNRFPQSHPNYRVHSYHLILVVIRSKKKDTRKGKTIKKDNLGARLCKYVELMYVCTKDQYVDTKYGAKWEGKHYGSTRGVREEVG